MNLVTSRISRLVILAALFAVPIGSVSQDKQQTTKANAGRDENDSIKRLISVYPKAADDTDPTLASRISCQSTEDSLQELTSRAASERVRNEAVHVA